MQHIHVDHALVTQALEHLTLVTNDRQPERSHLALQCYGLQLIRGEIGIILQKPAGLNAGIMLEIQFVANIRQCLWTDIVLGGKILQGIIEAYSAAGKTYLHEQVENQKEHAI